MITDYTHELISNLIPYGKENAISRSQLEYLTGLKDRKIRDVIHDLREEQLIISSSGSKGYYRPTQRNEILDFKNEVMSRIKHLFRIIKVARKHLKNHDDQLKENFK